MSREQAEIAGLMQMQLHKFRKMCLSTQNLFNMHDKAFRKKFYSDCSKVTLCIYTVRQ